MPCRPGTPNSRQRQPARPSAAKKAAPKRGRKSPDQERTPRSQEQNAEAGRAGKRPLLDQPVGLHSGGRQAARPTRGRWPALPVARPHDAGFGSHMVAARPSGALSALDREGQYEHSRSLDEALDMPVARQPLVPPSPPRAPDDMTAIGRMVAMRESAIGTWGQRAYEEDIIQGPLLRAVQLHSQHAGRDPACARRQLRELHADAGRNPGAASGARRRAPDRRRAAPGSISAERWRRPSRRAR